MKVVIELTDAEVAALKAATEDMGRRFDLTGATMAGWLLRDALISGGWLKLDAKDRGPGARRP